MKYRFGFHVALHVGVGWNSAPPSALDINVKKCNQSVRKAGDDYKSTRLDGECCRFCSPKAGTDVTLSGKRLTPCLTVEWSHTQNHLMWV